MEIEIKSASERKTTTFSADLPSQPASQPADDYLNFFKPEKPTTTTTATIPPVGLLLAAVGRLSLKYNVEAVSKFVQGQRFVCFAHRNDKYCTFVLIGTCSPDRGAVFCRLDEKFECLLTVNIIRNSSLRRGSSRQDWLSSAERIYCYQKSLPPQLSWALLLSLLTRGEIGERDRQTGRQTDRQTE